MEFQLALNESRLDEVKLDTIIKKYNNPATREILFKPGMVASIQDSTGKTLTFNQAKTILQNKYNIDLSNPEYKELKKLILLHVVPEKSNKVIKHDNSDIKLAKQKIQKTSRDTKFSSRYGSRSSAFGDAYI